MFDSDVFQSRVSGGAADVVLNEGAHYGPVVGGGDGILRAFHFAVEAEQTVASPAWIFTLITGDVAHGARFDTQAAGVALPFVHPKEATVHALPQPPADE